MPYIHNNLANGRWQKMSLLSQLSHIGSEVSRAYYWRKKEDKKSEKESIWRALELIDLTISDERWRERVSEIIRLREIICDFFISDNLYNTSFQNLQEYFLNLAIKDNKNKQ